METIKHLTGFRLWIAAIGVSLATFLIVLDYTIANVSIPYIAGDLGVSADEGTYVITSFAVGSAIALPITGWLTRRFGMVRLGLLSLFGFVFFSWTCGMAPNLLFLVVSRFLQGLTSGPLVPLSQTMIISIFPKEKKNTAIGFWGTIVVVAPVIGPILGGWISYDIHWPWIFFINIPFGLLSILLIHLYLRPFETEKKRLPTDWIGLILLTIGVSTLQFILDKGEQYDWIRSNLILTCMVISFLAFIYLIAWELTHPNPLLQLRLLKIPSYNLSVVLIVTIYAIYFGGVVLVPLWLQQDMGYTAIWAGVAVAPLGILPTFFSSQMSKIVDKIGQIIPLVVSLLFFALSSFIGAFFNTDVDLSYVAFSRFLFGFGLLFFIVPLFSLSVRDIPQENLPAATGMFHFFRAMMGGVGTSVFTTMWVRRSAFHHSNIVSEILPTRRVVSDYYAKLQSLKITGVKAQALLNTQADTQASVLGINDCFFAMGWIFIALLAILLLGRKKKPQAV